LAEAGNVVNAGLPLESIGAEGRITRSDVCYPNRAMPAVTSINATSDAGAAESRVDLMMFHCRSPLPQETPHRLSVALPSGTGWK